MPASPSASAGAGGLPSAEWLALVNRQALAVRLISTTVHDVNNILQVVSGAAEVLALDPSPAAVAKRTTSIVTQASTATAVLAGLVGFVRADSQAQDGAKPLALASQALAFRQHAFRKGRITAASSGDDVDAAIPRHHLQQVLLNLVVNAEHVVAGRGDGRVQIAVSGGDVVTVDVDDNGPGWPDPPDEAMARWPATPGTAAGALGLGLRVSRELVARAGGTLTCADSPLGGARVRLTVPALRR
ncbi:MAG: HAMP domain-containing sensor histidine kinase [Vicinamibacterales bacterium]